MGNARILECLVLALVFLELRPVVKPELQRQVFDALRSEQGQLWLNTAAHGTCAQLVSKRDLLTFPVIF